MADAAAMNNQAMRKTGPFVGRQKPAKILLDLRRILVSGEAQAPGKSFTVSVDNDSGCIEGMAQNHIGGFSPYTWKAGQFLQGSGHRAAEFLDQVSRTFFQ